MADVPTMDPGRQKKIRQTLTDPVEFAERWLGFHPWGKQADILRAVADNHARVNVKACHASGKCVAWDEIITLSDGSRVQAWDLIGKEFRLMSLEDGYYVEVDATAEYNASEPVYRVTTESGRTIVRNADHPLWMAYGYFPASNRCQIEPKGWTPIKELVPGDLVAVTEMLPAFGDFEVSDDEVKIVAYMIGDGAYTTSSTGFSQLPGRKLEEFKGCVDRIGGHVVRQKSPNRPNHVDYRVIGIRRVRKVNRLGVENEYWDNPVRNILNKYGMAGKHARTKRIPKEMFELNQDQMRTFLSRLYATDGWACMKGAAPQIGFCSSSQGLVRDIQDMLIRFGVAGRVEHKPKVHAWTLSIAAADDVLTFCDEIGIFGKELAVAGVKARALEQVATKQTRKWRWQNAIAGTRWERVRSVEYVKDTATIAIEVPTTNTYLTSFYEHNTAIAAVATLWFLARYKESIVVTTAPTWNQVETLLWPEIHNLVKSSKYPFPRPLLTELKMEPKRYAIGLSTSVTKQNEGVRFQGFHAANMLIVKDEAPGVDPKIYGAIDGIRAGGNIRTLDLGNPTISSGPFFEAFQNSEAGFTNISISAFDTPNLEGMYIEFDDSHGRKVKYGDPEGRDLLKTTKAERGENQKSYLTTRAWVYEKFYEWGPNTPMFQARVLGIFPESSEFALISMAVMERQATEKKEKTGKLYAGIDVAGEGEAETVLCLIWESGQVELIKSWEAPDPRGPVLAELIRYRNQIEEVNVDSIGVGYNFAFFIRDNGFKTNLVNVSRPPSHTMDEHYVPARDRFSNLKSELYWNLREQLHSGFIVGIEDKAAISQLTAIQYGANNQGKIEIESKDEMKKRGVASPDRAEAIMLASARFNRVKMGLINYLKQEGEAEMARIDKVVRSGELIKPVISTKTTVCPYCESTAVAFVAGKFQCNQCGRHWVKEGQESVYKVRLPNRGDLLTK